MGDGTLGLYETYVEWRLIAVVKRRIAFDPEVQLLLNVYNGPAKRT